MTRALAIIGLSVFVLATGCARVVVTKNPSSCDEGLRFYRPKPFLLVTPDQDKGIAIELKYLPDYSEEYSIRMTPGLNATTTFNPKLDNGWNLIGFESTTDQNVDDLITSIGTALPQLVNAKGIAAEGTKPVKAKNVPFGFYEAVIECDERGCKRLMGWRYVGFFAYGSSSAAATAIPEMAKTSEALFNLVWKENGVEFVQIQ